MTLPPIPPWEGVHVLIVHFPIALLMVTPLLVFFAMFTRKRLPGFALATWLILFIGTISTWVAVAAGVAAFNAAVMPTDAAQAVADRHREMGENAKWIFTGLCAAYGLVLLMPTMSKRVKAGPFHVAGSLVFLAVYAWAALYLANTSHLGGRLVHEFGVTTALGGSTQPAGAPGP